MKRIQWMVPLALAATLTAAAQTDWPKPTAAQQAGIDKDTSRHFGDAPLNPGPKATNLSAALTPAAIDFVTRKVAEWQLPRTEPYEDQIWVSSVLYAGFLATSDQLHDEKYRDAMRRMGERFHWQLRGHQPNQDDNFVHLPNADDQSLAQVYLELFLHDGRKHPEWISPSQAEFDAVLPLKTLRPDDPKIPWWWCDALFMAPPAWARLAAATGDHKYIDYLNEQWARTYELLWDKQEQMYARDATYKGKLEANGRKMFWSRGEGWVMGGLARTLQFLPKDDPRRGFYEQNLRDLSARLAGLTDKDGVLHAGLLDPEFYPLPEISGTALMTYGMAWGVNNGVLDRAKYLPVIRKAWQGMLREVYADGRLGDLQQTGPEPAFYPPSASFNYGVGGFLLAASEVKKLAAPQTGAAVSTDPGRERDFDATLPVPANPKLRTLFLVGDSTVRNGRGDGANNQMGWGEPLRDYFDPAKINVVNRAIGGRSSRTYITEEHWRSTLALIKKGDVVLFQFGHNDAGPLDDAARARGTIRGTGNETAEIENPILKKHETVHTFGWYMAQYIADTRAKGAIPIICSLIPRKSWKDGHVLRNAEDYAGWARTVAQRENVGFIDLNEITARKYDALGEAAVEPLFGDPRVHTSLAGAIINAESVVAGLKALPQDPVARDFSAKGVAIPATDVR